MQLLASPFQSNGGSPEHALEAAEASPEGPPHPSSYMDILDMLQQVSRGASHCYIVSSQP